ncbi:hydrolase [Longispora fulva]|nr:hydrolase [Longispora fulva]
MPRAAEDDDRRPGAAPRLVVLDLDGTVVPYSGKFLEPSPRVRKAIARAIEAGATVTVATGRAVWTTLPTVRMLGLSGIELVCSDGAVGYDLDTDQVIFRVLIDAKPAVDALAAIAPDAGFAVEHETDGYLYTAEFPLEHSIGYLREVSRDELVAQPTARLICRVAGDLHTENTTLEDLRARRREAEVLLDRAGLSSAEYHVELGYSGWMDITRAGVNKGSGVARLAANLGITAEETLVIGDAGNDLAMFAWAGHSVAMGQAADPIKAAADEVTATVEEDGVALILEKLF